ncbi:MAG: outer membrane protein assembly factor BamA [Hyphomicrobiaceae bacterium]
MSSFFKMMTRAVIVAVGAFVLVPVGGVAVHGVDVPGFARLIGAAEAQTIRQIQVEGNRRVEPETVRTYLTFTEGDSYDEFEVDASLKALFATGLFSDVQIDRAGSTVIVKVVENPVINQVAFEGNSSVDDETLAAEVQLKPRSVFTRARVQSDVQRILDVYTRQGLFTASVEPKIIALPQNRVDLVFEIAEGGETKVQSINFVGNRSFTDSDLRDAITTTETGLFSFLKSTNVYDPDRLNLDRELLRQFYLKNGFADAQVLSAVADLDQDGTGFFITFTIDEGVKYNFGEVTIESSLAEVDVSTLSIPLQAQAGDTYNAALVEKDIERITLAVAGEGYAFARVRPRAVRDEVGRTIGVIYGIEQGPRVYIERIDIFGNTRTEDKVIRREFRLVEGDAYNQLLVNRARQRLQALGFFKTVKVRRQPGSAADRVTIAVSVVEESTGELSLGGGYSTSEGIIADISITERNLLGKGQFLRLKLGGSLERLQADLSFTEPRFLDRNLAAGFDLFHKEVDQSDESSFRSRKSGGGLRLGFPIAQNLSGLVRYNLVRDQLFDVQNDAGLAVRNAVGCGSAAVEPVCNRESTDFVSSVGYTITYDTRNSRKNPTSGLYGAFSQDIAGVGGDISYVRSVAEGRAYYNVTKGVTLIGRVIGGHIVGYGGDDVRLLDSFYKGGETIRGFDRSGFGPRDSVSGDALGGTIFYAATAELRFPFPIIPEEFGLSGAIFADAGSLYDVGTNVAGLVVNDSDSIRSSVGASLLWNSPLGPLRADYAYVLSSEAFDDEQAIRFGASTAF